jgi:hypothetical protein
MTRLLRWLTGIHPARDRATRLLDLSRHLRGRARACTTAWTAYRLDALADAAKAAAGGDRTTLRQSLDEAAQYRRAGRMRRVVL